MNLIDLPALSRFKSKLDEAFAKASHRHSAADVTSGTLPVARGGTGATTSQAAEYAILGNPANSTTDISDGSRFAMVFATPDATQGTLYARTFKQVYGAIKTRTDAVYAGLGHTHNYLPLSGGTLTGQIAKAGTATSWYTGRNTAVIRTTGVGANEYFPIWSAKSQDGSWECGPYTSNILHFSYVTDANYSAGTDQQTADIQFTTAGAIIANTFQGSLSGNASTASKAAQLTTARTLTIGNTGKSFNGSGDVSWSLAEIGAAASSHSHGAATQSANGFMSANDKKRLDGITRITESEIEALFAS